MRKNPRGIVVSLGAAIILVGLFLSGGAALASASENHGHPDKVYVCKYVGTPGTDERLQTGQNPILVSINSIPDYQGVGSWFADAQGRSFVLAVDDGTPHFRSECPGGEPEPSTSPPTTEPPTTEPPTTEPPTTEPPTTEPPTTEPPTTEPPTTEPPTTEPPTTEPVTTEPVTSEPPTTEPPTTEPVTTEPVTSEPPSSSQVPSSSPVTSVHTTDTLAVPTESQVIRSRPASHNLANTGSKTGFLLALGLLAVVAGIMITIGATRIGGSHK